MARKIKEVRYDVQPVTVADPLQELQARAPSFTYLLAHADDGVIWGVMTEGVWQLSSDAFPDVSPRLRVETLQQARLFNVTGEFFLWHTVQGWQARIITDEVGEATQAYDEAVIVWGTNEATAETRGAFTALEEADLGIKHTPPLKPTKRRSLKLIMRHYLAFDDCGAAFVKLSRLVDLTNGGEV